MSSSDDDMMLIDEPEEVIVVNKKKRRHSVKKKSQEEEEDDVPFSSPEEEEEEEPKAKPQAKKTRLHNTIIPSQAATILNSYAPPTKSHASIEDIYDKRWSAPPEPTPDKMEVEEPKQSKKLKPSKPITSLLIDEPNSGKKRVDPLGDPVPGSTTIMDPRILDAKNRHIADNLSKILDDEGVKQLLGVKSSVLDVNAAATEFINTLTHQYKVRSLSFTARFSS